MSIRIRTRMFLSSKQAVAADRCPPVKVSFQHWDLLHIKEVSTQQERAHRRLTIRS